MLLKVQGTKLVRDTTSNAIINQDKSGLEEYQQKRNALAAQRSEINTVKTELKEVKEDIQEIKQMLLQLMDKKLNG